MKLRVFTKRVSNADGKAVFAAVSLESPIEVCITGLRDTQVSPSALREIKKLAPQLRDELMLIGAIAVAGAYAREQKQKHMRAIKPNEPGAYPRNVYPQTKSRRQIAMLETHAIKRQKIEAFDRIVEMLDHHEVNGKPLGDCRRADLLRAAAENLSCADDLTVHAALYKQLAGMIGDSTVREYRDRAKVVALLTTTFEAAA